ncbi:MAG TPA: hypothetical protein VM939_12470, partial [Gemmatimonadaceae bacterium]|nr:hypothetical protein [Gemmatimonadaceae bacterium]
MTPFASIVSTPLVSQGLAALLVEIAIKSTLLIGVALLIVVVLRRSTADMRHMVWSVSLGGLLIVPILGIMLPSWRVPLLPSPFASAV